MITNRIAKFCVLTAGIMTLPAISFAGTPAKEVKEVVEKCKESCITGDIGINVVSQYVSRGVIFENQGGIIQPYADLYFKLYEGEGFLNKVSLNLGIWNSFHSRKTDAGLYTSFPGQLANIEGVRSEAGVDSTQYNSSTRGWYEFDFTAGVSFTFAKNFTFTPSYYRFDSPNDGFASFQGLNLKLAWDSTDLVGINLGLYAQVLFELENKAGTGSDEGVYYEVGIAPSFPVGPITLTFPIFAGFGSNDFYGSAHLTSLSNAELLGEEEAEALGLDEDAYSGVDAVTIEDESFGFLSAGVTASYNLPFIPECYGTWTVSAGYAYYHLGDGTSDFNTLKRGGLVRDEEENEHVFSGGLMVAF